MELPPLFSTTSATMPYMETADSPQTHAERADGDYREALARCDLWRCCGSPPLMTVMLSAAVFPVVYLVTDLELRVGAGSSMTMPPWCLHDHSEAAGPRLPPGEKRSGPATSVFVGILTAKTGSDPWCGSLGQ